MARKKPVKAAPAYDPQTGLISRGLLLVQPLATLVAAGAAGSVRLAWGTNYRGRVYLYAGMLWGPYNRAACNSPPYLAALKALGYGRTCPLPFGAITGYADIKDIVCINEGIEDEESTDVLAYRFSCGRNHALRYHWVFTDPFVCYPPVKAPHDPQQPGRVGLFRTVPDHVQQAFAVAVPAWPDGCLEETPHPGTILEYGFSRSQQVKQ
jgi:hypothetical protein